VNLRQTWNDKHTVLEFSYYFLVQQLLDLPQVGS